MPVVAEAEQDEIEPPVLAEIASQVLFIARSGLFRRVLAAHAKNVACRDRDAVEQRGFRHMIIAAGSSGGTQRSSPKTTWTRAQSRLIEAKRS